MTLVRLGFFRHTYNTHVLEKEQRTKARSKKSVALPSVRITEDSTRTKCMAINSFLLGSENIRWIKDRNSYMDIQARLICRGTRYPIQGAYCGIHLLSRMCKIPDHDIFYLGRKRDIDITKPVPVYRYTSTSGGTQFVEYNRHLFRICLRRRMT